MDRKNRFGAFSESFDLMREQLAAARESERLANIGKKELVASLSHDVKTPVSSIKVIAELFQAKHGAAPEMESIIGKADQIDLLISNLFTATLEELQQLKVSPAEIASTALEEHIRASDYQKKVRPFTLPECVVTADSLRFRQVVDNIIGNSYKYAESDIEASGGFDGGCFVLTIRDFGPGVSPEELSLLTEKFYRASNAEGKSGSGLGLYLSRYFIHEMGGTLELKNDGGLWVIIRLKM
jgi:signal transduction histidine kinase